MLIKHQVLERIASGTVTLAFRRWKRPTVKTGGQLRTAVGILAIDAVTVIKALVNDEMNQAGIGTS